MERISFITYHNCRVLLADCSDCSATELAAIIDEVPKHITREPLGSVLAIGDFSHSVFSKEVVEHLKLATVFDKAYVKRAAWVLTENLDKTLYESVRTFSGRDIPTFSTRQEALDYLVNEEQAGEQLAG